MKYDTTKEGDRVSWTGLNRTYHGTVRAVTDRGLIADVDGGGVMILSTSRSMQWEAMERKRRHEDFINSKKAKRTPDLVEAQDSDSFGNN